MKEFLLKLKVAPVSVKIAFCVLTLLVCLFTIAFPLGAFILAVIMATSASIIRLLAYFIDGR